MSGPAILGRRGVSDALERELQGRDGWAYLEERLMPALMSDPYRPADRVMTELARWSRTEVGAEVIAWLHAISDGAPWPKTGLANIEQTALAAAKHEGRASVGQALSLAIAEGQRIIDKQG